MKFAVDSTAILIALLLIALWIFIYRKQKQSPHPHLLFSNVNAFKNTPQTGKTRFSNLPQQLFALALLSFLLALIDPHFASQEKQKLPDQLPTEGIAIYLLLDQSGSMAEKVPVKVNGEDQIASKISLLKGVTKTFIQGDPEAKLPGHQNDLLGLIAFARTAKILSPLTLDHRPILNQLDHFDNVHSPDEDGTAIGYAIFKTVNLIKATKHFANDLIKQGKPAYLIKNAIIVIVTDGFQYPSPRDKGNRLRNIDLDEASAFAKENGVKLYLINIDPNIEQPDYQPQRNQMKRITEATGGKFYILANENSLQSVYSEIDRLEKSKLPDNVTETIITTRKASFFPFFVTLGLLLLAVSIFLNTTILRQIP